MLVCRYAYIYGDPRYIIMSKAISQEEMGKKKPTSLNVDEDLWVEVRIAAMRNQMTATDFVEAALKEKLAKVSKK
jgi:hypothetical protein